MASVPKASAAPLGLSMAAPSARGGPDALYDLLAGLPILEPVGSRHGVSDAGIIFVGW